MNIMLNLPYDSLTIWFTVHRLQLVIILKPGFTAQINHKHSAKKGVHKMADLADERPVNSISMEHLDPALNLLFLHCREIAFRQFNTGLKAILAPSV